MSISEIVILHCAPTLAGLKPASLFTCHKAEYPDLKAELAYLNAQLNSRNIFFQIVASRPTYDLVMIYEGTLLWNHIQGEGEAEFLRSYGYKLEDLKETLRQLMVQMQNNDFPHEVGIFLGYPLEDVKSFIREGGRNYKDIGYWKVYHNEVKAHEIFKTYKRCVEFFQKRFHRGVRLEQLVLQP